MSNVEGVKLPAVSKLASNREWPMDCDRLLDRYKFTAVSVYCYSLHSVCALVHDLINTTTERRHNSSADCAGTD